jgi:iron complex transport system permease protein
VTRSIWISLAVFAAVAIAAPLIGSTHIDLTRAWNGLSPDREILLYVRLPRVLLALIAGAALAVTGVLFQCLLRDPLAEPYTLGSFERCVGRRCDWNLPRASARWECLR